MPQSSARKNMALSQLMTNEIHDARLLAALDAVPREDFVPQALKGAAYVDDELPLGNGRFLMAPLPFARLLALAEIQPEDRVLDVGCAFGYSTAVLAHLAGSVVACESDAAMMSTAQRELSTFSTVRLVQAALTLGAPAHAPYDVILLEGAISAPPEALLAQLADGGRLVAVERRAGDKAAPGVPGGLGQVVVYTHLNGQIMRKTGAGANVPLLPGFERPAGFVF